MATVYMGKRGTRTLPTTLKIALGNPGKKKLPEREPKPELGCPDKPVWMSAAAAAEWDALAPVLDKAGVLTVADGHALASTCELWAIVRSGFEAIHEEGTVIGTRKNPRWSVTKEALQHLLRLMCEFGMTPSARAGLVSGKDFDAETDIDAFAKSKMSQLG